MGWGLNRTYLRPYLRLAHVCSSFPRCCNRVVRVYELGEDWCCSTCRVGDWGAPLVEVPAAAKWNWEAVYAEPPAAGDTGLVPGSEKSESWGADGQQGSEPEAEAGSEAPAEPSARAEGGAGGVTQGVEQESAMDHEEREPMDAKRGNPNEPAAYPWRQAQYQRCSPAKRRRLSMLDHGVLISWHRNYGSLPGGNFE